MCKTGSVTTWAHSTRALHSKNERIIYGNIAWGGSLSLFLFWMSIKFALVAIALFRKVATPCFSRRVQCSHWVRYFYKVSFQEETMISIKCLSWLFSLAGCWNVWCTTSMLCKLFRKRQMLCFPVCVRKLVYVYFPSLLSLPLCADVSLDVFFTSDAAHSHIGSLTLSYPQVPRSQQNKPDASSATRNEALNSDGQGERRSSIISSISNRSKNMRWRSLVKDGASGSTKLVRWSGSNLWSFVLLKFLYFNGHNWPINTDSNKSWS